MVFNPEKGPLPIGKPEEGESRENEPSQVFIYATEFTKTMEDHVDLKVLAENFSLNFLDHQNLELQKQNKASYSLGFGPSRKIRQEFEDKRGSQPQNEIIRGLTSEEQEVFMEAFKKANEEATKRKKK